MNIQIYDSHNYFFSVCSAAQEDQTKEHAFLFSGAMHEEDGKLKIQLKEKVSLEEYTLESDGGHIIFSKESLCASLKLMKETNQVFIFVHTHTDYHPDRITGFSQRDLEFEQSIIKAAKFYQYKLPLCFGVADEHTYRTHVFYQDQYFENVPIIFPHSGVSCDKENFHIFFDKNAGIAYDAKTNQLLKLSPLIAQKMQKLQEIPFEYRAFSVDWAMLESFYQKNFSDKKEIEFYEPVPFLKSRRLHKLEIMIQTNCNLACKYCYADGGHYGYGKLHLTPENAALYLEKLINSKIDQVDTVQFFGGEPTTYPDTIEEVCKYFQNAVDKGQLKKVPIYTMVTNLVNLSDKMLDLIVKYDIRITVSLDGPKQVNDQLRVFRNGEGSFDNVYASLQRLSEQGVSPVLAEATYTTLHQQQGYTKRDVYDFLKEELHIPNVIVCDCVGDSPYALTGESYLESKDYLDEDVLLGSSEYLQNLFIEEKKSCFKCNAGSMMISLLPDGKIYPCHLFLPNENYCIADLKNGEWNFDHYPAVYDSLLRLNEVQGGSCHNCWARLICIPCSGALSQMSEQERKHYCQRERKKIESVLLSVARAQSSPESWERYVQKMQEQSIR